MEVKKRQMGLLGFNTTPPPWHDRPSAIIKFVRISLGGNEKDRHIYYQKKNAYIPSPTLYAKIKNPSPLPHPSSFYTLVLV